MLNIKRTTIRKFAKLVGKLVAAEPAVQYASLFTKPLEKVKEQQLKLHRGNFDSFMNVPSSIKDALEWWIAHVEISYKHISKGAPSVMLFTDASLKMRGAYNETHDQKSNGFWSLDEQNSY